MKSMLHSVVAMVAITISVLACWFVVTISAGASCLGGNCSSSTDYVAYLLLGLAIVSGLWTVYLILRKLTAH